MDSVNKAVSFVLGLAVVIIIIALVSGRLKLNKLSFLPLSKGAVTITPKIFPTAQPIQKITITDNNNKQLTTSKTKEPNNYQDNNSQYKTTQKGIAAKTIPNTGVSMLIFPVLFSSLFGGIYLKKKV